MFTAISFLLFFDVAAVVELENYPRERIEDRPTALPFLLTLTLTSTYTLIFNLRRTMVMQTNKVKGQAVQNWSGNKWNDGQTDTTEFIAVLANAVGN